MIITHSINVIDDMIPYLTITYSRTINQFIPQKIFRYRLSYVQLQLIHEVVQGRFIKYSRQTNNKD
jgi:hypothetical protein